MDDANKVPANMPKLSGPQANTASTVLERTLTRSVVSSQMPTMGPSSAPSYLSFIEDVQRGPARAAVGSELDTDEENPPDEIREQQRREVSDPRLSNQTI